MYIKFLNDSEKFEAYTLKKINEGVIRLHIRNKPPNPYAGFKVYLDSGCANLIGNYEAYRTKYKDAEDETVLFLSTGEVYREPPMEEIPELTPEEIAAQEHGKEKIKK